MRFLGRIDIVPQQHTIEYENIPERNTADDLLKLLPARNIRPSEQFAVYLVIIMVAADVNGIYVSQVLQLSQFVKPHSVGADGDLQMRSENVKQDIRYLPQQTEFIKPIYPVNKNSQDVLSEIEKGEQVLTDEWIVGMPDFHGITLPDTPSCQRKEIHS